MGANARIVQHESNAVIIRAWSGPVTVITKLYGPVNPERLQQETKATKHRAAMLDLSKKVAMLPGYLEELAAEMSERVA